MDIEKSDDQTGVTICWRRFFQATILKLNLSLEHMKMQSGI